MPSKRQGGCPPTHKWCGLLAAIAVKLLVVHGANVNVIDSGGGSALWYAVDDH
ncbi:MAG: hypothetical protein ACRYFS_04965 [Janthinobacterium lividum]